MSTTVTYKGDTIATVEDETKVLATGGKFLEGDITLTDVASGGGMGVPGIFRPEAELVDTMSYSFDHRIVSENLGTIPSSYSTSTQTILTPNPTSKNYSLDVNDYDYVLLCKSLVIPEYATATGAAAGKQLYEIVAVVYRIWNVRYNVLPDLTGGKCGGANLKVDQGYYQVGYVYGNGTNWTTYYSDSSSYQYGVYSAWSYPSVSTSNNSLSIAFPYLKIRGQSTRFTQTHYEDLTDVRYQWKAQLYRLAKGSTPIDGTGDDALFFSVVNDAGTQTHTLS